MDTAFYNELLEEKAKQAAKAAPLSDSIDAIYDDKDSIIDRYIALCDAIEYAVDHANEEGNLQFCIREVNNLRAAMASDFENDANLQAEARKEAEESEEFQRLDAMYDYAL
jgi:hypothetical protein